MDHVVHGPLYVDCVLKIISEILESVETKLKVNKMKHNYVPLFPN